MGRQVLRLGDPGSHGGVMTSSSSLTDSEGIKICRTGDTYSCAIHGSQSLIGTSAVHTDEGKTTGLDGDQASCGASISATGTLWELD